MFANNKEVLKATDARVTVLNELITSIRFIKFFAWERGWSERVLRARQEEVKWFKKGVWLVTRLFHTLLAMPFAFTVSCFASYTLIEGKKLDIATSFTAIALFTMLRGPLGTLPMVLNMIVQTSVSVKRIKSSWMKMRFPLGSLRTPTRTLPNSRRPTLPCLIVRSC